MAITMVGSLNHYIKTLSMQQKWTERQQKGDYSGKEKKSLDEWIRDQSTPKPGFGALERTEAESNNLQSIQMKVSNGKKLTPEEKAFLEKHDPETLKKAYEIERTRESFKQALRRCRTKEDVERLRMTQLNASMTTLNAVENNPNIPLSKKLEIALQEQGKVNAVAGEIREYIEDGHYEKLPTDAEKAEAEKQENEIKHPETTEKPEQTQNPNESSDTQEIGKPSVPSDTEYATETRPEITEKPDIKLETPEQRKVKRAKIQAAYGHAVTAAELPMSSADFNIAKLDTKG